MSPESEINRGRAAHGSHHLVVPPPGRATPAPAGVLAACRATPVLGLGKARLRVLVTEDRTTRHHLPNGHNLRNHKSPLAALIRFSNSASMAAGSGVSALDLADTASNAAM